MALELTREQIEAGWTVQKLGDFCRSVDYGFTASATEEETGCKFLRITDIKTGYCDDTSVPNVKVTESEKIKYLLKPGDIVVARTGATTGVSAWLKNPEDMVFASYLVRFSVAPEHNSRFISYLLKTKIFKEYIHSVVSEKSAQPNASATTIALAELPIPPLDEQNRIAKILGSLDDKIEANNALNTSLRELFKLRFSSLVEESSREFMLTDMAEFINGKAFTKGASGTGRMVIRIAELNGGPGASTVYNEIDVDSKHEANPGDILMSWSGSLGVFLWSREQAIINQHIFKVIPKSGFSKAVIFCALENVIDDFRSIALEKATTMGHIKRDDLEKTVRIPTYNAELEVILNQICVLEQENLDLADTRDLLIRKLIK